jgi:subtilisin family serine protease
MGFTGQGIVIANQDTGMRWTHAAIKPHYRGWNGTTADHNYNWHDSIHSSVGNPCGNNALAPCDDHGHGTHTTGTTSGDDGSGNQIGVAPGAKWIGCRNMDAGAGTPSTYTECFQFFIAPTDLSGQNPNPALRPHVMNNSWGCPTSEGCGALTLETVVNNTQAAGIFVEASAGNSGPGCGSVTDPPANYGASFSTGAIDINNNLASFSSRGPGSATNLLKPNVSAPGVSVRSSYNNSDTGYTSLSGTSMAGPHVVGVVALLWSAHPELSRDITTTKQILQNTANPGVTVSPAQTCGGTPSNVIPNNSFGYGRVDALAAVNSVPFTTPTPTQTASPTPTSTATPAPSLLRVHVLLQGRPAPPHARWSEPITLTLRPSGGGTATDYAATTDSSGYFTVTVTTGAGSYNWRAKNSHALAVAGAVSVVSGVTPLEAGTLLEGDGNNDNCVSAPDLNVVRQAFGSASGSPNYNPNSDFNIDGAVNTIDFNLFRADFGMCGPGPIR